MLVSFCKSIKNDVVAMLPRRLGRLTLAQRKALVVTLISLLGWSLWNGLRTYPHPWGDLSKGQFTDHFSHMNAARVFPHMGRDIWRVPIDQKFTALTADEIQHQPRDIRAGASGTGGVFHVPGWPAKKPLAISWSNKTRMYPPGDMILVAPIALLYHYTSLNLQDACRMLLGWYLVLAHGALFFFFLTFFENKGTGIDWMACFLTYSQVLYWTLQGFYDPVAMIPLLVCVRYLARGRGLPAAVAYCTATMVHFRVFFQAPWALYAGFLMLKNRFWRGLRPRDGIAIVVAVVCAAVSLYVFWLDWASLGKVYVNNPLHATSGQPNPMMLLSFKVVLGLCLLAFLLSRAWLDLVTLAWLGLVCFKLRELYFWHFLISMSWFALPAKHQIDKAVRLAFLMTAMAIVFNDTFAPTWLQMVYNASSSN